MRFALAAVLFLSITAPTPPQPTPTAEEQNPYGTPTATASPRPTLCCVAAVWTNGGAMITWQSSSPILCVDRRRAEARSFVGCGTSRVLDPSPKARDTYILLAAQDLAEVSLRGRMLLPLIVRPMPPGA